MITFDRQSVDRIIKTVQTVERQNRTDLQPGRKRRNIGGASVVTVKPIVDADPGDEVECEVWEGDEDTGRTIMVKHMWADWATIPADTEHFAVKPRGWTDYVFMIGDLCAVFDNLPTKTFANGNSDYFLGIKNESGNHVCCRVLAEEC